MTHHVVLSGGIDSTTALALTLREHEVRAITFFYGQRHSREVQAATAVADHYGVAHEVIDLYLLSGSALLGDGEVPDGHYADETMAATVVQGRNLLFAAAAIAQTQPGDTVVFGVHTGDHAIYPDCRLPFWYHLAECASAYEVRVERPFIEMDKASIVVAGAAIGVPYGLTWSCYKGGEVHCGRCGTCVERAEAFAIAGHPDPTHYADPLFWQSVT